MPETVLGGFSGNYASVLFSYAGILNCRDKVEQDLKSFGDELAGKNLNDLEPSDAKKVSDQIVVKIKAHEQTKLLFEKLFEHRHIHLFPAILKKYIELQLEHKGIIYGLIITATKISKTTYDEIAAYCQKVYVDPGKTLVPEHIVDPNIKGEWYARIDGRTFGITQQMRENILLDYYQGIMGKADEAYHSRRNGPIASWM